MATHDYVIDNSTGANVRADINLVLQAILTNNSSSSAPSTTAAYMWWADTTNGVLKIRNSANNDWVELLQLDGTLTLEDGTNSAPALAFRDDLDTGIYSSAANTFNIATGGTERMELGTTTIFNEDGADVDFKIEGDGVANLFYLDASADSIGIGTSSPDHLLHCVSSGFSLAKFESTSAGDTGPIMILYHNSASPADNDFIGGLYFHGNHSGGSVHNYSYIAAQSVDVTDGTEDSNIIFATSVAGATAEAMRIEGGKLLLGTTTEGFATADDFTIAGSGDCGMTIRSGTSSQSIIAFSDATSGSAEFAGQISYYHSTDEMVIGANTKQTVKIHDEHINVFAAEGTSRVNLGFSDTNGAELSLYDDTGSQKTRITGSTDTNHFFNNGGNVGIGLNNPGKPLVVTRSGNIVVAGIEASTASAVNLDLSNSISSGRANFLRFLYNGSEVGGVYSDGSTTVFNTGSDYRLKENVVAISDGITRLKALKPSRFNFKRDSSTTIDGFLAHEVSSIVPEAISGTKDEVATEDNEATGVKEGDPIYQGIDQSKLVPLLTAALQESISKIEVLETKVAALEAA